MEGKEEIKTLNLAYPERSEIKFTVIRYSDSQVNIEIMDTPDRVRIVSRMSWDDIQVLLCVSSALCNKHTHLYAPYMLGARSDRRFESSGLTACYMKHVTTLIINAMQHDSVTVIDPHSDVTEALVHRLVKKDNSSLVANMLLGEVGKGTIVFVSPDAGAMKKVQKVGEKFGRPVVVAMKHRDEKTGHLTDVQVYGDVKDKNCVIVDDICDGGRTFINLANKLKELGATRVVLCVTHGIFSQGFEPLRACIDHIYTTNSVKHLEDMEGFLTVLDIMK